MDDGHIAITRISKHGTDDLHPLVLLFYCLWVADYGMRNAGDLAIAADLLPQLQTLVETQPTVSYLGARNTKGSEFLEPQV